MEQHGSKMNFSSKEDVNFARDIMSKEDVMDFARDIMFAFHGGLMNELKGKKAITKRDGRSKNPSGISYIKEGERVEIIMPVPIDFGDGKTTGLEVRNTNGNYDVFEEEELEVE